MLVGNNHLRSIWSEGSKIKIIDQTLLPFRLKILQLNDLQDFTDAIVSMKVRGAPLIGVTALFGVANEMNKRWETDNLLQFEYLLNTVRPKKRFAKWVKKDDEGDLSVVKEYYGYNDSKALQALSILSSEQLIKIRKTLEKGGSNDG